MDLREYQWFNNPRGLHNSGPFRPFDVGRYMRPQVGWAKLVAGGDEYTDEAAELVAANCMPIVRISRSDMGAMEVPEDWYEIYDAYMDAGVRWFELYDEPNMDHSWPFDADGHPAVQVSWENREQCIMPLMDNWLVWAERIIEMGGYPAFPALAETGMMERATVYWLDAFLNYLLSAHKNRFLAVAENGLWCATHPYLLNHFYQEPPGGPPHVARPHYQQSAEEDGWHFEYPYDPIRQYHDAGRTVFGGTSAAPYGDPQGLIASGEAFQQFLFHKFNAGPIPVVGTAGGIVPVPHDDNETVQPDELYPPYTRSSHVEATMALWRWIAEEGPTWFFGLTLMDEAELYDAQGELPVIERMAATPPQLKTIPSSVPDDTLVPEAEIEEENVIDVQPTAASSTPIADEEDEFDLFGINAEGDPEEAPVWMDEDEVLQPEGEAVEATAPDVVEDLGPDEPPDIPLFEEEEAEGEIPELPVEEIIEEAPAGLPPAFDEADSEGGDIPAPSVDERIDEYMDAMEAAERIPPPDVDDPVEEDLPGWLAPEDLPAPESVEKTDTEWLADVEEDTGQQMPPAPEPDEEVTLIGERAEVVPAWLEEEDLASVPDDGETVLEMPAPSGEALPEWLEEEDITAPEATPPAPIEVEEGIGIEEPPAPEPGEDVAPIGEAEEVPAWLDEDDLTPAAAPRETAIERPEPVEEEVPSAEPTLPPAEEVAFAPITGMPDNHWLLIGEAVDAEWFFTAGMRYWQTYRPTLMSRSDDLALLPADKTVAVTVLTTDDELKDSVGRLQAVRPDVQLDIIVAEKLEDLMAEFNRRASTGQRFG